MVLAGGRWPAETRPDEPHPEGCMVLAGGRWPPETRRQISRIPEGCMEMAKCHTGWMWRVRPMRNGLHASLPGRVDNGDPDPGATGPRLISKGPPGPRHSTSGRTQRVAMRQHIVAGPTCFRGQPIPKAWPNAAGGPRNCGPDQPHPGGMHGISRGPVAPGTRRQISRIPEGCMVLAGGRWPPETRPTQNASRRDAWKWLSATRVGCGASGQCATACMRPSRDASIMVTLIRGPPAPG